MATNEDVQDCHERAEASQKHITRNKESLRNKQDTEIDQKE